MSIGQQVTFSTVSILSAWIAVYGEEVVGMLFSLNLCRL